MADVVVFGLDTEAVFLDDIQMDVPHAQTVIVPEEKAVRSKDLWRALSQKRIFQLTPVPNLTKLAPAPSIPADEALKERALRAHNDVSRLEALLEQERTDNQKLREENATLRARDAFLGSERNLGKLDEILKLLQNPKTASVVQQVAPLSLHSEGLVEVDAPAFVPSEIRSKDIETRVEVSSKTSKGGSVSGATEALRRIRQNQ